jgi:hypothetical protein
MFHTKSIFKMAWHITSPMPEEAPVISTTFPDKFSLKIELKMERKNL